MIRMLKVWFLLLFVSLQFCVHGQQTVITELPRWMIHGSLGAVIPEGYMTRYVEQASFAGYLEALYRVKPNKPILLGLSMARFTFQKESIEYADFVDGIAFEVREKTAFRFQNVAVDIRFQPELNWVIQPYIQGQLGWHYLYTNTIFRDLDANENFETINNESSSILGYGLQAGIQIIPNFWYVRGDLRISYFRNPSVDILARNDDGLSSVPIFNFEARNTPISLIFLHAGVSYLF